MKKIALATLAIMVSIVMVVHGNAHTVTRNIREPDSSIETGSKGTLTIMTYNIALGDGCESHEKIPKKCTHNGQNLPKIAEAINSIGPDIVGLQEVRLKQAEFLAKKLNLNYTYAHHGKCRSCASWWGVALLSRYQISKSRPHSVYLNRPSRSVRRANYLKRPGPWAQRTIQECMIQMPDRTIRLVNVQLPREGELAEQSVRMLRELALREPAFLIGDFGPTVQAELSLCPELKDTCEIIQTEKSLFVEKVGTGYGRRDDRILCNSTSVVVQDVGLISKEYWEASDHRGYFARITLR